MNSDDRWVPLSARASETGATEFTRLHSGVPAWMRESLWEWFSKRISVRLSSGRSGRGYMAPSGAAIREIERVCRVDSAWNGGPDYTDLLSGLSALRRVLYSNEMAYLTAVDFQLSKLSEQNAAEMQELETILRDSASEWRVGIVNSKPGLVQRIDQTVQTAAEEIVAGGTRAGDLLAHAWRHAFSMTRDPSAAYRCAVRAIEAAAAPILTPDDPRPSLGKMNAVLRDGMSKWDFAFTVDSAVEPKVVLLQMMQLIWTNEYSRHVDADDTVPLHVSQEEAESAVVLALTLVNWFTSGSIKRVL
jgi:hypothetical protein